MMYPMGPEIERRAKKHGIEPMKGNWLRCGLGIWFYEEALKTNDALITKLRKTQKLSYDGGLKGCKRILHRSLVIAAEQEFGGAFSQGFVTGFDNNTPSFDIRLAEVKWKIGFECGCAARKWLFDPEYRKKIKQRELVLV